jgi:hypothetical protein
MRVLDVVLSVSLASLVASLCTLAMSQQTSPPASVAPVLDLSPQKSLAVHDAVDPEFVDAVPDPTVKVGTIRLSTPEGGRVRGVADAMLFPDDGGRPHYGQWVDVSGTQVGDLLDLRHWLKGKSPSGTHYLTFGALVDLDGRTECRNGWIRLDPASLLSSGVRVEVPRRLAVDIAVATGTGQPVPGALVAVEPLSALEVGLVTQFAYTDESGTARVAGLYAKCKWIARLVDGVGPARDVVDAQFDADSTSVRLTASKIDARWRFVRHEIRFPFWGASTRVEAVDDRNGSTPCVFAVARWIGPGRGPATEFWTMTPESRSGADKIPVSIEFAGRKAVVELPDALSPRKITLPIDKTAAAKTE